MSERLVVRGGLVVDGSGLPGFLADVEVVDGRIAAIGRVEGAGAEVVDADGLVVAPGFIDIHTHYDAQLQFEPTASPSSWHGVTTVAVGNCGFSLAPCHPADVRWTLDMLSRVEGMSADALAAGVSFGGGSMADFLAGLDGAVGVNVMAYAGHCALRRYVMGEAASEREATAGEIADMQTLLRQCLADGAVGLSTSQLDIHVDHEGRPVPSNLASHAELEALAAVLAEVAVGALEIFPRSFLPGVDEGDWELLLRLAELSGKPVHGNVLGFFASAPDGWRRNLELAREARRRGLRYHPMLVLNPKGVHFSLDSTFIFDEYLTWRAVLTLSMPERMARLADPEVRAALAADLEGAGSLALQWQEVSVAATRDDANRGLIGRSIAQIAAERAGADPLAVMIDLALSEDLATMFAIRRDTVAAERAVIDELVGDPLLMPGSSDGGAHLLTFCGADYTTRLLTESVPGRLSLEQAVSRLTFAPASTMGLWDRGLLRPGMAADLVLFDPDRLAVRPVRMVHDLPAGAGRLVFDAEGYVATIVNGRVLMRDGVATGELPGQVLRAGAQGTTGSH